MIKNFFKKIDWSRFKAFFARLRQKVAGLKLKKPNFSALKKAKPPKTEPAVKEAKKIKLPKIKKPKFSWMKKIKLPAPIQKAWETARKISGKIFCKKTFARLSVALCAVALGGILILWDTGVINLPFLTRRERREPLTGEEASESTTTTTKSQNSVLMPSGSDSVDAIRALYALAGVNIKKTPVTDLPYDGDTMTITKQILPAGSYTNAMGFVVKSANGTELLFTAPDLAEVLDSSEYHLTQYRSSWGDAVFTKDGEGGYYCFEPTNRYFYPITFDPAVYSYSAVQFALPRADFQSVEGKTLFSENGLYGYQITVPDGKKTKTITVPALYTKAYNYSEGFAVMADAEGKVTIRNELGEEVFTEYNFILPEYKNEEALGFTRFDGGVLRVVVAGYDANGNLTSRRETMINTRGQEVSVPAGYRVVSLHEGILLVTDGEYYGYLSSKGAWISPPVYTAASPYFEGLAVATDKDGKMGLLDSEGKTVLPFAFDLITSFSEGNALCYAKDTGWYLLTKVAGIYHQDPSLEEGPLYTKITITRGPQNTFDYEPDEIIELLPPENPPPRTTRPENTISQEVK